MVLFSFFLFVRNTFNLKQDYRNRILFNTYGEKLSLPLILSLVLFYLVTTVVCFLRNINPSFNLYYISLIYAT